VRSIKILALATATALAAVALVGTTSASATSSTQLCGVHTGLVCPLAYATTSVHLVNAGEIHLKNELVNVSCSNVLMEANPLQLDSPQLIHATVLWYFGCGPTGCEIKVKELPLLELLKTGLDEGAVVAQSGIIHLTCKILGVQKIDCKYDFSGLSLVFNGPTASETENGRLNAEEVPLSTVPGSEICPEETTLDGLLSPLSPTYVLS
jgi:hypothetical protein